MSKVEIPKRIFLDRLGGDEVYGYGQDGDVTITADTSLSRDMYYNNLTINSSCTLDTNGYRIFVRGTLTFTDSTSRIGRFSSKTTTGTLRGGAAKGVDATDTLGGRSAEQTDSEHEANEFLSGSEELYSLSVAIAGRAFDTSNATYKFVGGGSGTADSSQTTAAQEGQPGGNANWANRNVVGASGGKGATGNAATYGTGAAGGGVVVVVAKTISGDGTIRADGDDAVEETQGTAGADAPDYYQAGNNPSGGNQNAYYGGNNPSGGNSTPPNPYYGGQPPSGGNTNPAFTHYHYAHYHPTVYINSFTSPGFSHQHYHLHPGNTNTYYPGNNPSGGNPNPPNPYHPGNNPSGGNYNTYYGGNPNIYHAGGAGGAGEVVSTSYNAGGGTVVLVSGTKPLPSGLTTSAAAGTGGAGTATAGTILTIYNIAASDTAP